MFLTSRERIADYVGRGWWDGITVDAMFQAAASAGGEGLALVDPPNREKLDGQQPERLSWASVRDRVEHAAAGLLEQGLRKDDVVCAQLPNVVDAVILFLACARVGLILTPVVMQYREHELSYILDQTEPRAFVTVPHFAGYDHAAMADRLAGSRPALQVLLLSAAGDPRDFSARCRLADPSVVAPYVAEHPTDGGEVLTICWTSGTESRPKGVPRDHNHWVLNAKVVAESTGMVAGDTLLNPFPLVNIGSIGGLVMTWLHVRGRLVLHHPFDLPIFLQQIEAEQVTYTIAPPAVLTSLLQQPALIGTTDIGSLRAIGSGSAPLSPWLIEGWLSQHGIQICNVFGSNEGASLFANAVDVPDPAERARYFPRFGAKGTAWPALGARVSLTRLVDLASGAEIVEPGQPGEMRIAGASTFSTYWRSPEITARAFDDQGYFCTGDLFEIAGDGPLRQFYRFLGRTKEIIVRGGVNISPAELDELIVGQPLIKEAATVGIPDPVLGERVAVAVVPQPGEAPTLADIGDWMASKGVAIFKRPELFVIVDELPRNAMKKVVRNELREQVLAALKPLPV